MFDNFLNDSGHSETRALSAMKKPTSSLYWVTSLLVLSTFCVQAVPLDLQESIESDLDDEKSNFVQVGDMALTKAQYQDLSGSRSRTFLRNGIFDLTKRWPKGVIPYELQLDPDLRARVLEELSILQELMNGCITFRPATETDRNKLVFEHKQGACSSNVGMMIGINNKVFIHDRCPSIIHEVIHTLGFTHEFNRPDRADYANIVAHNVKPGFTHNFLSRSEMNVTFGVPFNFYSIMAYYLDSFSKNGGKTIEPLVRVDERALRASWYPAHSDLTKLRRMYGCSEPALTCPTPWQQVGHDCVILSLVKDSYAGAKGVCASYGGRLYEPRDFRSFELVKSVMKWQLNGTHDLKFWMGIRQKDDQSLAAYESDHQVRAAFLFCDSTRSERNTALDFGCYRSADPSKRCIALVMAELDQTLFEDCHQKLNFVCEIPEQFKQS